MKLLDMSLYSKINDFVSRHIIIILLIITLISIFKGAIQNYYKNQTNETTQYKTTNNIKARALTATNSIDMASFTYNNTDRKIVKTFNLNIIVKNIDKSTQELEELLKKYNGYVENFYSYEYENNKATNFTIKVPTNNISQFMKDIKKDGYIKNESFSASDFTEQYTDNENKLKNLYVRRDKLRTMMNKQAEKLADVIAVDRELNNVQNEIERLEKSNLKIQNKVDYSQINLTIEPEIMGNKWSIKKVITDAINTLILACQMIIHYFITFIVFLPLFLGFFIVSIFIKKVYLYIKRKCIKQ